MQFSIITKIHKCNIGSGWTNEWVGYWEFYRDRLPYLYVSKNVKKKHYLFNTINK